MVSQKKDTLIRKLRELNLIDEEEIGEEEGHSLLDLITGEESDEEAPMSSMKNKLSVLNHSYSDD